VLEKLLIALIIKGIDILYKEIRRKSSGAESVGDVRFLVFLDEAIESLEYRRLSKRG
jgi:hypothetical protein